MKNSGSGGDSPAADSLKLIRPLRVMVVDDNVDAGSSLVDLLCHYGYAARYFSSASFALSGLESFLPDVCISDIGMPGMDGYQFARAIRLTKNFSRLKLIALSGYALAQDIEKAIDSGFDVHLSKTVDPLCILRLLGPSSLYSNTN